MLPYPVKHNQPAAGCCTTQISHHIQTGTARHPHINDCPVNDFLADNGFCFGRISRFDHRQPRLMQCARQPGAKRHIILDQKTVPSSCYGSLGNFQPRPRPGARRGLDVKVAAHLFGESTDQKQTQPGAFAGFFRGHERFSQSRRNLGGKSGPWSHTVNVNSRSFLEISKRTGAAAGAASSALLTRLDRACSRAARGARNETSEFWGKHSKRFA